jgi:hypothetical protein
VGVNIGDVIVEPHDIFGHGVNIAARLRASRNRAVSASPRPPTIKSRASLRRDSLCDAQTRRAP